MTDPAAPIEGTVVRIDAKQCLVDTGTQRIPCRLRGALFHGRKKSEGLPFAVGDRVRIRRTAAGGLPRGAERSRPEGTAGAQGVVEEVLPRRTKLSRPSAAPGRPEQVIVANVDQVVIVAALRAPDLRLDTADAYLAAADAAGLGAILCFHKADLVPPDERHEAGALTALYEGLGIPALTSSTVTGEGLDALRGRLRDRISVLAGHSGVGKSSILNAIEPSYRLRTGDLGRSLEGTHTTTAVSLLPLPGGGQVVDTPGVREFGLWAIEPAELRRHFPEFAAREAGCRFRGCQHLAEPGCAVLAGVADGSLARSRHDSYRLLRARLVEAERERARREAFRRRKARRPRDAAPPPIEERPRGGKAYRRAQEEAKQEDGDGEERS